MRFRTPTNVLLRRAQLVLILAGLVPTVLLTALGIVLLVLGIVSERSTLAIVGGALVLAFCTSLITATILVWIFVARGASLARVQTDFLSSVSHELRTPITSMRMFVETLRDDRVTDPVERQKCLDILQQEIGRLDGLVERLIELSRIETGRQAFEMKPVAIAAVVEDALRALQAATLGSKVEIPVTVEPGLEVVGDRAALTQALVNLLTNAWKYTPAQKNIAVSAASEGKLVHIAVTDNGPGVPREERQRIFEEFERGRAAVESGTPGSGLGLAIVRAIVRQHRGRLEIASGPSGAGAAFRIALPRHLVQQ